MKMISERTSHTVADLRGGPGGPGPPLRKTWIFLHLIECWMFKHLCIVSLTVRFVIVSLTFVENVIAVQPYKCASTYRCELYWSLYVPYSWIVCVLFWFLLQFCYDPVCALCNWTVCCTLEEIQVWMHFFIANYMLVFTKTVGGRGSAPDPAGGAYDAPPDPLIGFDWALSPLSSRASFRFENIKSPRAPPLLNSWIRHCP